MKGCDYEKPRFSVPSPGTKSYREAHDRIFNCRHGNLKSKCTKASCIKARESEG